MENSFLLIVYDVFMINKNVLKMNVTLFIKNLLLNIFYTSLKPTMCILLLNYK